MHAWSGLPPEVFIPRLAPVEAGPLVAQGRVLDALAGGVVLRGSSREMARHLGVRAADLTAAVRELTAIGWLARGTAADGCPTVLWADDAR